GSRSEGNLGIGFAVPSNTIRDLLPQLRTGKVTRGRIGVSVTPVPREDFQEFGLKSRAGAVVATVSPGGASAKAGIEPRDVISDVDPNGAAAGLLRQGDVILAANGHNVTSAADARAELQKVPDGRIARILLWRGDGEVFVTVKKD